MGVRQQLRTRIGPDEQWLNRVDISDRALKWILLLPSVFLLAFLSLYPFLQGVWMSLHELPSIGLGVGAEFVGAQQYVNLFGTDRFINAVRNTVVFTGVGVTVQIVLGTLIAVYLRSLTERWRPVFRTIFIIPMMMTPIATGLMWRVMLDGRIGVVNYFIGILGFTAPEWTSSGPLAMFTILLIDTWQWTPLVVLIVYAGLLSVPQRLYEAARIDGAPRWAIFYHITLPQIKFMIAIAAVFRLMRSFRTFDYIWLVTQGGPGTATEILNIYLYRVAFVFLEGGKAAATGILLLIATIAITMGILKSIGEV
jgi:multiple sugar transport system permease protein